MLQIKNKDLGKLMEINNRFSLKTLTPISITSGDFIDSFEYLIQGNYFYRLETNKIIKDIMQQVPGSIDKISEWVEQKENLINNSSSQAKRNYKLNLFDFITKYLSRNDLEQKIRKRITEGHYVKYKIPTYLSSYSKNITPHIKTADNKVYIPGSTLKGLIRNALLNDYFLNLIETNNVDKINLLIKKIFDKLSNKSVTKESFSQDVVNNIFNFGSQDYDAKFDLMKLVKVTDSNYVEPSEICELVQPLTITKNGNVQGQLYAIEVIKKGVTFEFTIDFDVNFLKSVANSSDPSINKALLKEKLKDIINLENINNKSDQEIKREVLETIENAIFNVSIFIQEKDENFQQDKKVFEPLRISENDILTKIGWGAGFHSKTILFSYLDDICKINSNLKGIYQQMIDKFNIGQTPGKDKKRKDVDLQKFPTSRKVVKINNFYNQMGWVKIERIRKD